MNSERIVLAVLAVLVFTGMVTVVVRDGAGADPRVGPDAVAADAEPPPRTTTGASPTPSPTPTPLGEPGDWVVTRSGGTPVSRVADGVVDEVAAGGLTWPILSEEGDGYRVATHCDREAWVAATDVARPAVARQDEGMADAVVVLDPGHGGIDAGALGPDGLTESEVVLDVADRLRTLLERDNDVDETDGTVRSGDQWPAVAEVLMTRDPRDEADGELRTSLGFRGRLASVVDADAFLSLHLNAGDSTTFDEPASEVLYSVDDRRSERLGALVLEELRRSLAPLADEWRGTTLRGTIGRADPDGSDYYTTLEEAEVPAVITEALYLSSSSGEELARTDVFRDAYAEALYRALVRFLETDDTGDEVNDPITFRAGEGGTAYDFSDCSLAAPTSAATAADSDD